MLDLNNGIIRYMDLDESLDSQKVGLFVVKYQAPTYIRLLSIFNSIDTNFYPCTIDVSQNDEIQKVRNDLLNDDFPLDIVIIQRDAFVSNAFVSLLLKKCKLLGIKVIYEIDDDLMNIDSSHKDYSYYKSKREGIYFLIKNADIVTVSTNALKNKINSLNDNIIVIPNVLADVWNISFDSINHSENIIKIGYMGSHTHKGDLLLLENVINSIKEYYFSRNKQIIFELIGGTNDELYWANQIKIPSENTNYPNFVKFIKQVVDWDIVLAPLEDTNINLSKSELKYLEYTGLRVPGIYSKIGPYEEHIIHGYNGLLVENNNVGEWKSNIIELINNLELRNEILCNAIEDVNNNHSINDSINSWNRILNLCIRDKNSLLYKNFNKYKQLSNSKLSFIEFLSLNSYEIIKSSELFDDEFYLSKYEDVKLFNSNPLKHFLELGVYENCQPLKDFDCKDYLLNCFNLKNVDINPFLYYVLYDDLNLKDCLYFDDLIEEMKLFFNKDEN